MIDTATRSNSAKAPIICIIMEKAEMLPPVLAGADTPAVRKRDERFYSSVGEIFECWVTRRQSPHTQRAYREDADLKLTGKGVVTQ